MTHIATWLIDEHQTRVTTIKVEFDHAPSDEELDIVRDELESFVYARDAESLAEEGEGFTVSRGDWMDSGVELMFGDVEER